MTNDELDRLEALANAATPGPWPVVVDKPYKTAPESEWYARLGTEMIWGDSVGDGYFSNVADAQFIAAARDAVPALVDEVRRLQRDAARWAFIRDSGQLAVKAMRLLDGSDIAEGYVGGPYADAAMDAIIAKEERRMALEGA